MKKQDASFLKPNPRSFWILIQIWRADQSFRNEKSWLKLWSSTNWDKHWCLHPHLGRPSIARRASLILGGCAESARFLLEARLQLGFSDSSDSMLNASTAANRSSVTAMPSERQNLLSKLTGDGFEVSMRKSTHRQIRLEVLEMHLAQGSPWYRLYFAWITPG